MDGKTGKKGADQGVVFLRNGIFFMVASMVAFLIGTLIWPGHMMWLKRVYLMEPRLWLRLLLHWSFWGGAVLYGLVAPRVGKHGSWQGTLFFAVFMLIGRTVSMLSWPGHHGAEYFFRYCLVPSLFMGVCFWFSYKIVSCFCGKGVGADE